MMKIRLLCFLAVQILTLTGCDQTDLLELARSKPPVTTPGSVYSSPLIGQWLFHGDTLDSSGQGNDITLTNGSFVSAPGHDSSPYFSLNKGSQILTLNKLPFTGTSTTPTTFTITTWLATNTGTAVLKPLFAQSGTDNAAIHSNLLFGLDAGILFYGMSSPSNTTYLHDISWTNTLPSGTWVNVAVRRSGNSATLFINGVPRVSGTVHSYSHSTGSDDITQALVGSLPSGENFDGFLEDLRIYKTALTDTEIRDIYGRIPTSGLSGEWLFDNSTGADTAGSNNGNYSYTYPSGKSYLCTTFNPSTLSDLFEFSSLPVPDITQDFTISQWIYPNSISVPHQDLFIQSDNSFNSNLALILSNSNVVYICGGISPVYSTTNINVSQWTHIALVKTGSTLSLYINGSFDSFVTVTPYTGPSITKAFLGSFSATTYPTFNGKIDTVRTYNRALTTAEISQLANE